MKFSIATSILSLALSLVAADTAATPGFPGLTVTPAFTANLTLGLTITIPLEGGDLRISK